MHTRGVVVALAITWAGCGGQNDGELGGHCYPNGSCNVGLSCSRGICLPMDASMDAPIDATVDALVCTDTAFEPNDTVATAFVTGVASTQNTRTLAGQMICPAGDKDHFAVAIPTPNTNLEMLIDFDGSGPTVQGSILNSGGQAIANASLVTGMPGRRRAYTPNLPTGDYYLSVYAAPAEVVRYTLTVTVTGP